MRKHHMVAGIQNEAPPLTLLVRWTELAISAIARITGIEKILVIRGKILEFIIHGKPPALPGDPYSLAVPGVRLTPEDVGF